MLLELYLFSAVIGLFAVVYRYILAYEEILAWWFRFGARFENYWFWKPVWGCELCIAGQLALWTYVFSWIGNYLDENSIIRRFLFFVLPDYGLQDYSVLGGAFFVSTAIAFAWVIYKGFDYLKED